MDVLEEGGDGMSEDKTSKEIFQEAILALTEPISQQVENKAIGLGLIGLALSIAYLADTLKEAAKKGITLH